MHAFYPTPLRRWPLRCACMAVLAAGWMPVAGADAKAAGVDFDSSFLHDFGGDATMALDLTALNNSSGLAPGRYPVDVRLNGQLIGRRSVHVLARTGQAELHGCLSQELLDTLEVDLKPTEGVECIDLASAIEGASQRFDGHTLTLDLSIPQAALRRHVAGFVDEQEWDRGIDAFVLNYQLNAATGQRRQMGSTYQGNLYLQAGLNLGGWRLRSHSALTQGYNTPRQWQRSNTYAQRDLSRHWGTLTLGENFTPGNVFDSLPYRGLQLSSDMGMLPDSQQGYAPVVRGIAESQAKVEVRQNGYSLYSTFVPPGPFVIDDLSAAGGSGELEVIITEANGRERRFTQPYATLGNMLREGVWRHSVTLGQYNSGDGQASPAFTEATLAYGLPLDLTLYGGLQASSFYQAIQAGVGINLGRIGALSLDLTRADTQSPVGGQDHGQSYGWRYGKSFTSGTALRFAGYRYSTEGYRDFGEAVWQQDSSRRAIGSKRHRLEASLSQSTPYGSLFLSLTQQTYWQQRAREQELQLGLSTYAQGVTYGLYASRSLSGEYPSANQLTLTVSLPLGRTSSATYTAATQSQGSLTHRASLSGSPTGLADWRYGVNLSRSERGETAATASLNHRATYAQLGGSLSHAADYRQATLSASGSLLAHADGIEFGQALGETLALIDVSGVADVGVQSAPGTRTNARGYALVPYLTPYRRNRVALDTRRLGLDIDIENTVAQTVPRRGAVIKKHFKATRSRKLIAVLRLPNGKTPPFGSQVLDRQGRVAGIVGPGGQVLLAMAEDESRLVVKWHERDQGQCALDLTPVTRDGTWTELGPAQTVLCQDVPRLAVTDLMQSTPSETASL
jgi:outer membrane usher protein